MQQGVNPESRPNFHRDTDTPDHTNTNDSAMEPASKRVNPGSAPKHGATLSDVYEWQPQYRFRSAMALSISFVPFAIFCEITVTQSRTNGSALISLLTASSEAIAACSNWMAQRRYARSVTSRLQVAATSL
jgi:hypothetical protein